MSRTEVNKEKPTIDGVDIREIVVERPDRVVHEHREQQLTGPKIWKKIGRRAHDSLFLDFSNNADARPYQACTSSPCLLYQPTLALHPIPVPLRLLLVRHAALALENGQHRLLDSLGHVR